MNLFTLNNIFLPRILYIKKSPLAVKGLTEYTSFFLNVIFQLKWTVLSQH